MAILKLAGILLLVVSAFTGICGGVLAVFQIDHFDRIYPGVSVWGVDLGGRTRLEATERLTRQLEFMHGETVYFRDEDKVWAATPGQVGMSVRVEEAVQNAFTVGHTGDLLFDLGEQWVAFYDGVHIAPVVTLDMLMAEELLKGIASIVNVIPSDASLSVIGSVLTVSEGKKGRTVDVSATAAKLVEPLTGFYEADIPLVIDEFAPMLVDAEEQREIGQRMLEAPLVLMVEFPREGDGPPWVVDQQALADMLTFIPEEPNGLNQKTKYKIGLDQDRLKGFLEYAGEQLEVLPKNSRFGFDDESGELELLRASEVGRAVDVAGTLRAVNQSLEMGTHNVYIRFDAVEPEIDDDTLAADLGITGLVVEATTQFRGSGESRLQNIRAGSETMHGVMVPPGEVFSFNSNLGSVSLDTGFAEAWIIFGGRTIQGVGGGICQVSTTVFRSAFYGGYPIVERNPHAYRVGYYEQGPESPGPGLDATVFSPVADFRFINDRDAWLIMESDFDEEQKTLTFRFYSAEDGRNVAVSEAEISDVKEPKETVYEENRELDQGVIEQVDWENEGAKVIVERVVERGGELLIEDFVRTTYQPWGSVFQFGPGTELPEDVTILWADDDDGE